MTAPADLMYLADDQADRLHALDKATELALSGQLARRMEADDPADVLLEFASRAYRWLRHRDSLLAVALDIVPGTPQLEGTPVATVVSLEDTQEVSFSLSGTDAKGASVPLDAGYSAAWSLSDPDGSGATATPSADTTSCVVAAGTPTDNLSLSVTVTNPDGSTLTGVEAIQVVATAATAVVLTAGTPTAE